MELIWDPENAMSNRSTSSISQTDWDRLRSMSDSDVDLSEIPEIAAEDVREAVLWVGGKPVPEGKSLVGLLLDADVLEHFRSRAGATGFQTLINDTLRASMAKA